MQIAGQHEIRPAEGQAQGGRQPEARPNELRGGEDARSLELISRRYTWRRVAKPVVGEEHFIERESR